MMTETRVIDWPWAEPRLGVRGCRLRMDEVAGEPGLAGGEIGSLLVER